MPLVNGKLISPDRAIESGLCPECGRDLRTVNPIAHRRAHWFTQPRDNANGREALRRMAMLDKFIVDNKVRTSDQPKPDAPNAAPID